MNATYATLSGLGNVSIPGLNTISNTLLQTLSHNTTTPTSSTTQHTQTNVPLPENPVQVAAAALGQLSRQPHTRDPNENQVIDHVRSVWSPFPKPSDTTRHFRLNGTPLVLRKCQDHAKPIATKRCPHRPCLLFL